jgi:hypothetical protein
MQQMREAGNEADIVFQTNEKTAIFNNPLCAKISQLAINSRHFIFAFYTQVTLCKKTECFSVGPI